MLFAIHSSVLAVRGHKSTSASAEAESWLNQMVYGNLNHATLSIKLYFSTGTLHTHWRSNSSERSWRGWKIPY